MHESESRLARRSHPLALALVGSGFALGGFALLVSSAALALDQLALGLLAWVVQLPYSARTVSPVRGSVVPAASGSMVMQPSTGHTLTQRLQATHSASFTSNTRPGFIQMAWCEVSSQAAKHRPH